MIIILWQKVDYKYYVHNKAKDDLTNGSVLKLKLSILCMKYIQQCFPFENVSSNSQIKQFSTDSIN